MLTGVNSTMMSRARIKRGEVGEGAQKQAHLQGRGWHLGGLGAGSLLWCPLRSSWSQQKWAPVCWSKAARAKNTTNNNSRAAVGEADVRVWLSRESWSGHNLTGFKCPAGKRVQGQALKRTGLEFYRNFSRAIAGGTPPSYIQPIFLFLLRFIAFSVP